MNVGRLLLVFPGIVYKGKLTKFDEIKYSKIVDPVIMRRCKGVV